MFQSVVFPLFILPCSFFKLFVNIRLFHFLNLSVRNLFSKISSAGLATGSCFRIHSNLKELLSIVFQVHSRPNVCLLDFYLLLH